MAKSARNRAEKTATKASNGQSFVAVDKKAFDPSLSSLFASSLGPVKPPPKSRYETVPDTKPTKDEDEDEEDDEEVDDEELSELSSAASDSEDEEEDAVGGAEEPDEGSEAASGDEQSEAEQADSDHEDVLAKVRESVLNGEQDRPNKKRKRADKEEVEDVYMRKLAREEEKEEEQRQKKQKKEASKTGAATIEDDDSDAGSDAIPRHETLVEDGEQNEDEIEKASRTVFLGNVSSEAIASKSAKKTLMKHLASFIDDLADHKPPHKVESLRFRSTAFASALPKKAAYAKKELMDATTKSTNAYAVYTTQIAAREAAKRLNGSVVLNRHLRVDSLAHPAKVDHRRCVFVGNLGFVDDESSLPTEEGEKKKNRPPGDVEEGLWVQFSTAGKVESVRVVRDSKTRVGKGIAYVQFEDENGVEAALQFNDQKYPPLLPRKLRVVRAKAPKRKEKKPIAKPPPTKSKGVYNAKVSDEQKTSQGRARAMLGKAGAFKSAESFVFEGHRASSKQGNSGLKLGGKKKAGPKKPSNRSTKRAAAWKASGGKK